MLFLASEGCFWPLAAFLNLEVKKSNAHVTMKGILIKISEIKFSVRCLSVADPHTEGPTPKTGRFPSRRPQILASLDASPR